MQCADCCVICPLTSIILQVVQSRDPGICNLNPEIPGLDNDPGIAIPSWDVVKHFQASLL